MTDLFFTLIVLPYLTTGRRLFAFRECLDVLRALGESVIASLVEEAIAHDMKTMTLERAWERSKQASKARGDASRLDNTIGKVLGAIRKALTSRITISEKDDPAVVAANEIIATIFPRGIRPITRLPFEDKLAVSQTIVGRLEGDLADRAAAAGIEEHVARLKSLNEDFAEELRKTVARETGFDALEAARTRGNLFVRQIVAKTLGEYTQVTEEDAERRAAVLKPLLDQVERLRQARRARRAIHEVDPDTGEEIPSVTEEGVIPHPALSADGAAAAI